MSDYFIYQNHKIQIFPGEDFSKIELIHRLNQMNVELNPNEKSKKYLCKKYNESIKNNNNKMKIIEKLIEDTNNKLNSLNEIKKIKEEKEKIHQNNNYNPKVNNIELFNPTKNNYIYDKFKVNNNNNKDTKNNYEIPSSFINDSEYFDYNNNMNFPNNKYMAGNEKNIVNNYDKKNIDPNSFPNQNQSIYKDEYPLKDQDKKTINPDYFIKQNQKKTYTNFETPYGPESNTSNNYNNINNHKEYHSIDNNNYNPIYKNEGVSKNDKNNFPNSNNNMNTNQTNDKNYDNLYKQPINYDPNIFLNNKQNSFQNINKQPIINKNNVNINVNKNMNNPVYQNIKNQNTNQTLNNINKNTDEFNKSNKFMEPFSSSNQNNIKEFNQKPISYPNLDDNNFQKKKMNNYQNMYTNKNSIYPQNQNNTKVNYNNQNNLNIPHNHPNTHNKNMYNHNIVNNNNNNNNQNMYNNGNISNNNNNNNKYNNNNNMYNPQNYTFNQNYQNDNEINTTRNFQKDIPIQYRNVSLSDPHFNNNNNNPNIPYNNHYYIYNNVPSNNPENNKETSNIGYTLLAGFLAMTVLGFGLWVIMKYSKIVVNEVTETLSPKNIFYNVILKVFLNFIKKLCWDYVYYTLPFVIFNFGIKYFLKIYKRSKLIKEIFNDIKSRLIKIYNSNGINGVSGITEGEIINNYSIRYNITFNDFNRNFMPKLRELRKGNHYIKEKEEIINGHKQLLWYWNE